MSNAELIRNLQEAMQSRSRPAPYDATAVVTRVDGTTAWVRLAGSDTETPIKRTIDAKAGDVVQVRVSGGSAWINGNQSAPPTDDTTAIEVKQKTEAVERTVETTVQTLEKVADVANDAKDTAREGKAIAEATDQYFWADTNGAHVALTPKGTDPNGATGFNSLWNMLGLLLRNGGNILAQFGQNGIAFYDGSGNNAANVLASFGTSGIRVGKSGQTHIQIASDNMAMSGPDGNTALKVTFEQSVFESEIEYGVRITDENNTSYIIISPATDANGFTDELMYDTYMHAYNWQTNSGRMSIDNQGFVVSDNNGNGGLLLDFASGLISAYNGYGDLVEYEDVDVLISYEAGTIGSRAALLSVGSTVKSGYTYIGAYVQDHRNTSLFNATISHNAPNDTAHLCVYRATGNAVDGASVTVRKIWLKTGAEV